MAEDQARAAGWAVREALSDGDADGLISALARAAGARGMTRAGLGRASLYEVPTGVRI